MAFESVPSELTFEALAFTSSEEHYHMVSRLLAGPVVTTIFSDGRSQYPELSPEFRSLLSVFLNLSGKNCRRLPPCALIYGSEINGFAAPTRPKNVVIHPKTLLLWYIYSYSPIHFERECCRAQNVWDCIYKCTENLESRHLRCIGPAFTVHLELQSHTF